MFDDGHLPASADRVANGVPVAPPFLPFAEGQLINDAGGEVLIEVDLRESPIEVLPIRKREIRGPDDTSQPVAETGVICSRIGVRNQRVKAMPRALGLGLDLQR